MRKKNVEKIKEIESKNDDLSKDDLRDVLIAFIQEHYSQIRHFETQRASVSNLIILISASILAFITFDKELSYSDIPLTLLLSLIGFFGALFSLKFYERANRNFYRIEGYRNKLDETLFDSKLINNVIEEANQKHSNNIHKMLKILPDLRVSILWALLHGTISLLGIVLTILCFKPVGPVKLNKLELILSIIY